MKDALAGLAVRVAHKAEDLRPIGDQILVKADPAEEWAGRIYIPETARKKEFLRTGVVISVGLGDMLPDYANVRCSWCGLPSHDPTDGELIMCPQCGTAGVTWDKRGPMHVKPGDRIVYDQASNRVVIFEGEEYLVCREQQHVIAVIG